MVITPQPRSCSDPSERRRSRPARSRDEERQDSNELWPQQGLFCSSSFEHLKLPQRLKCAKERLIYQLLVFIGSVTLHLLNVASGRFKACVFTLQFKV